MSRIGEMDFGKGREQLSTVEEVEKLKEPGKFELLATAVLCKAERDYRAILHSGLNAQAQPIKSPVDGFCRVPNSTPPRFVLVEHTVEDKLEKKWLFDHRLVKPAAKGRKKQLSESDDGDLLKAGQLAQTIKAEFPEAKFTVVLTTNQGLKPDFCLKVEKKAEELGVLVDFWDRSRIARFLDTEPEGQWLRKEYLGLDAEMLSESLLRDLCYKSLNEYRKQFLTSPEQWVSRQIDQNVEKKIGNPNCSIHLLIGNSGSGKSAAAYQIGEKHLATGGYSLWLSENVLVSSDSLSIALDRALHDLYPSLMPDARDAALRLLKSRERLLLIADDVNRTSSPANLLQKLVNWSKPVSSGESDTKSIPSRHLFVCPVWSDIARLVTPDIDKTPWIGSVYIGTMTPEEGLEAVQNAFTEIQLTTVEAGTIAEKLGNDPILIGLFADLVLSTEPDELDQVAENVTDNFINRAIEEVSRTGDLLVDEYRSALSSLTAHMLQQRKLNPSLIELKEWLSNSSDEMKALRQLVKHGKLCRIEEEKLVFRHDRLREAVLVESMGHLLNKATEPLDIFWEPYYAEIIGQAIVRYPQSEAFLKELCDRLPLTLVEAIRCFRLPTEAYYQTIVDEFKEWVNREGVSHLVPESVLDAICWKLEVIDSPVVLDITENLPDWFPILRARLRNGCTISGLKYFISSYGDNFVPQCQDAACDIALEQAKRYHESKLKAELIQLLESPKLSDNQRRSCLALVGVLDFTDLDDAIQTCWSLTLDKIEILPDIIWVGIRCCSSNPLILDPIISFWAQLIDSNQTEVYQRGRGYFLKYLFGTWAEQAHETVVDYLINKSQVYESLRLPITAILGYVDTPNAVEVFVRNSAEIESNQDRDIYWLLGVPDGSRRQGRNLSQTSLNRLKLIWEDETTDKPLKCKAFEVWLSGVSVDQLEMISSISSNSPLFKQAVKKRIELQDMNVVEDLILLFKSDTYWSWFIHHIWCADLMSVTEQIIESFRKEIPRNFSNHPTNAHDEIAKLLMRIPIRDAERLLEKHWSYLMYSIPFVQTAFCIDSPKCLKLATSSINKCPESINIFKYIGFHYGFSEIGKEKYFTKNQLNNLLPYIERLDESEIFACAKACKHLKLAAWSQKHLTSRLKLQHRKLYAPTDEDLLGELDEIALVPHGEWHVDQLIKNFTERGESTERLLKLIDYWLALHPTIKGFKIVAACIGSIGTRSNKALLILDNHEIEGCSDEINRIKISTQFVVYKRTLD